MNTNFNKKALEKFGEDNRDMSLESSNIYFDHTQGALATYLDVQIVIKWILRSFAEKSSRKPVILDVGAGKGRMTRHFAKFAQLCVALEPFSDFYRDLRTTCVPYTNIKTYNLTLSQYIARFSQKFDLIYVSGVTNYFSDEELRGFFGNVERILGPEGFLFVRDYGSASKTDYLQNAVARTREHMIGVAADSGFQLIRWRRVYMPFLFDKLYQLWPNTFTNAVRCFAFRETFFPFWELLAQLNLPRGRRKSYFAYLFRNNITVTSAK